ncbi:MAG: cupredoxin domain-containing protein [Minisyncoccota bacterium]
MQKNTIISLIISIALIGGALFLVSDRSASSGGEVVQSQNVEMRDGVQYVTIAAKGGYSPRVTEIKGGIPTKLVVKTDGTYDCSASLVVRSVGFQKILQPTGEAVIDLGTPKPGEKVQGVCGMGMYNFQIKAS